MPILKYVCKNKECKNEFEIFYTSNGAIDREEKDEKCPKCGSVKKKKLPRGFATSFILKGKGWARDRYS